MSGSLIVNLENLTEQEREQLLSLVDKSNNNTCKLWKPEFRDDYYYITTMGGTEYSGWLEDSVDEERYKCGNVFKTRELAENAAKFRRDVGIFENKMLEFAAGYEWKMKEYNYYMSYSIVNEEWIMRMDRYLKTPGTVYMSELVKNEALSWANKHYPNGLWG